MGTTTSPPKATCRPTDQPPSQTNSTPSVVQLLEIATQLSAADTPVNVVHCLLSALRTLSGHAPVSLYHWLDGGWQLVAGASACGDVQLHESSLQQSWNKTSANGTTNGHATTVNTPNRSATATDDQLTQVSKSSKSLSTDCCLLEPIKLGHTTFVVVIANSKLDSCSSTLTACRAIIQQAEHCCHKALQTISLQHDLKHEQQQDSKPRHQLQTAEDDAKTCAEHAEAARHRAQEANATQSKFPGYHFARATHSHERLGRHD